MPVEAVYVAPQGRVGSGGAGSVVARAYSSGARVFDLSPGVLERITDTVTPQPVLAVVAYAPSPLRSVEAASLVMVCADVRDPGNAGTMIRTAHAAGADAVICCDGTVDPTNPKTVRASAGSLFHLPVVTGGDAGDVLDRLKRWGLITVGAVVRGGTDYVAFDWRRRVALVFGNESSGLAPETTGLVDERVSIPLRGGAESLNVGSSAAVLCFEALRQRRGADRGAANPVSAEPASTMRAMEQPPPAPGTT